MNAKNQSLLLIDAVAAISIVLHHALPYGPYNVGVLGYFGLVLFSFSAGYKLMHNHRPELQNRVFLKLYMLKRFKRLYKPYISYTFLVLPFLLATIWIATNIFGLKYYGFNFFANPIEELLWSIISGENIVAGQLWYLVMLLEVTIFSLLVLYVFANIKVLFGMGFAMGLLFLFFSDAIESDYSCMFIKYGTIFIIGMFFATKVAFPEKITAPLLMPLMIIGSYSFYIYLFQFPFLIPIPGRILTDILHIHSIFVPIFLTVFTVIASIIICRVMKAFGINKLFE
ncbi:MAG: acyltransferase family protein [Methanothrix sp.]